MRKLVMVLLLLSMGLAVWGEEMTVEGKLVGAAGQWFRIITDEGEEVGLGPESDGIVRDFNYKEAGIALGDTVSVTGDFKTNANGKRVAKVITSMKKK